MKSGYFAFVALFFLGISLSISGEPVPYSVREFLNRGTGLSLGYIQKDGRNFYKASLGSDFSLMGFTVGMDVNNYFPSDSGESHSTVTFRKIGYEYQNIVGAQWGRLTHVTLGQGLLVNDYDSGSGGNSSEFSPQRSGFKGYVQLDALKLEGFTTARHLYGARAVYRFATVPAFETPLLVGGTYAKDPDGGPAQPSGQSGYAIDVSVPLGGDLFVPYAEYSQLENHGRGFGLGIRGDFLGAIVYRAEYRKLGSNFVPGYFGSTYEDRAPSINRLAQTGFLGMLGTSFFDNYIQGDIQVESYTYDSLITCGLGWKPILGTAAVVHYTHPLKGGTDPILTSEVLLFSVGPVETLVGMRTVFRTDGNETSYSAGATVSLTKLMGLPF